MNGKRKTPAASVGTDPLWYKDAVIYQLHVKAFADANGDGIGDFEGLTSKLDYIRDLGATCVWLLPFYPSPLRDDGYDIADYKSVHPSYGTIGDFRRFVREAHRRNLRVMTELIVNHTSDQHPWFQRARRAKPGSQWRDWYVWSDTDQKYAGTRIIFTDTETSNWTWDPLAKAYYWHRFFSHQPDLNFDNPRVIGAIVDVMRFWFETGVDGMRMDAVPYLCEREGTNNENLPETHAILKILRAVVEADYPGKVFLAEANQWPEDVRAYFGEGDEAHMCFHFPLMPRMFLAVADEDRYPIYDIMRQTPAIPDNCQWAIFLRNHDELTLEMVTDRERDFLYSAYASEQRARINVGIRRRLAPLMQNDRRRIELLNSLLFSMPGTPIVYYGDEIGMGDNIYLGDRDGVRTPMQWSFDRNGGFSRCDPARLYLPLVADPVYGFYGVNVESQSPSPGSLLSWMRRIIAVRQAHRVFGRGTLEFLYPGNRKVAAYVREFENEAVLCVANLSRSPQAVALDLARFKGRVPVEMLGWSPFPAIEGDRYMLTLPGHAFYWFLLAEEALSPSWLVSEPERMPEFETLVLPKGWQSLLEAPARTILERSILPAYLPKQRWFGAKNQRIGSVAIVQAEALVIAPSPVLSLVVAVEVEGEEHLYQLPLAFAGEGTNETSEAVGRATLARYRIGPRSGVLYDATAGESFARAAIGRMNGAAPSERRDALSFVGSAALAQQPPAPEASVRRSEVEQSNASMIVDHRFMLKAYRRVRRGVHPEVEIARYLDQAGYAHVPPLLGSYALHAEDGEGAALGLLQSFIDSQGDGWGVTIAYLERYLEHRRGVPASDLPPNEAAPHEAYVRRAYALGEVTAELHRAFARPSEDPAFAPEPTTARDLASWRERTHVQAMHALNALAAAHRDLPDSVRERAAALVGRRDEIARTLDALVPERIDAVKTRYHGDFHLGQVLVVETDFYILDFEGEPSRPIEERRLKSSPLRDVAGMLRSFNYAAIAALGGVALDRPEDGTALEPIVREWEELAAGAFENGYRTRIVGCPSYPDSDDARRLLDVFMLEKAFYEMSYELANRPSWLRIPLHGVETILGRAGRFGSTP